MPGDQYYQVGGNFKERLGLFVNNNEEYQFRGFMVAGDDSNTVHLYKPKAQKCPVCEGSGTVEQRTYISTDATAVPGTEAVSQITCHGCEGKGWVTV